MPSMHCRRDALDRAEYLPEADSPGGDALLRLIAHEMAETRAGIDRLVAIFAHNNECFRRHLDQQEEHLEMFRLTMANQKAQKACTDQMVASLTAVLHELAYQSDVVSESLRRSLSDLVASVGGEQPPRANPAPRPSLCPDGPVATVDVMEIIKETEPDLPVPVATDAGRDAPDEVAQTVEPVTFREPLPLVLVTIRSEVKITSSPFKVRKGWNTVISLPRALWQAAGFTDADRYRMERDGAAIRITRADDGLKPKRIGQTSVALQCTTFGDFGDITRTHVRYAPGHCQIVL